MGTNHRILTAVLVLASVCVGCVDTQERSNEPPRKHYEKSGGFSYDPPGGWEIVVVKGLKYRIARGPTQRKFASNINVVDESFGGTLSAYTDGSVKAMKKQFGSLQVLSREEFETDDGQPAFKVVTTNRQRGFHLRQVFFFLGTGRTKFVVTCTTLAQGGEEWDPLFEKSVATFRFH